MFGKTKSSGSTLTELAIKTKFPGFTLTELVIVMVLVGILAVVALPKYLTTTAFTGNFFYNDILTSIQYAQKYAVSTGCHIEVKPNFVTGSFILQRAASCSSGAFTLAVFDPSTNQLGYSRQAPAHTSYSSANAFPIYFDSLGRAHATPSSDTGADNGIIGTYTISIQGNTITIIGQTGYTF